MLSLPRYSNGLAPLLLTYVEEKRFQLRRPQKGDTRGDCENDIATGQPVGSFALAKHSSEHLSSATIRNICAELEAEGFLTHPHTSAGRMPTDKGYRYYVDNLMPAMRLSRSDAARINERLLDEEALANPERLMERTSHLLSQLSDNVGIVVPPSITKDRLHHVDFVKLGEGRILVITVSSSARVQDRVILGSRRVHSRRVELDGALSGGKLSRLDADRDSRRIVRRMTEEKALYDKFLRNAVLLCSQVFKKAISRTSSSKERAIL